MGKGANEAITIADLVSKVVLKSLSDSSSPSDAVTYFLGTRSGPPPSSRITLSHRQRRSRPRIRY